MSDYSDDGLTPFQRLILSRFPGQAPPADSFAGWSASADPSASAGLPIPSAPASPFASASLPILSAARAYTPAADPGAAAGLTANPPAPNFTQDLARYGQALQAQAAGRVTAQDIQGAEAGARAAGLRAGMAALPAFDAADPAYRWSTVVPQALGAPQQAPLPVRPAAGRSAAAEALAALAGAVDPRGAGAYSAAPLQAGLDVAKTQYNDRLRQFAQAQEQMNAQYAAERANAEQANRFAWTNAQETQSAAVRAREAQDAAALREAPYAAGAADAGALAGMLPALADSERSSLAGGAEAAAVLEKMNLTDKQYGQALEAARYTNSPLARIQVETLRQQGFYYRALLRKLQGADAP